MAKNLNTNVFWIITWLVFLPILLGSKISCSKKPIDSQKYTTQKTKGTNKSQQKIHEKDQEMSTKKIVELIKEKDWTLVEQKIQIDPGDTHQIASLLRENDPEVRELALQVLSNTGGVEARHAIFMALQDKDINVRSAACRFLSSNYDKEDLPQLLKELASNEDEFVRQHVALTIGKICDPRSIDSLTQQSKKETDPEASHALHLALVRLKQQDARKEYIEKLRHNDPKQLAESLHDFVYISDEDLLPYILPLLGDQREAVNVGPSFSKYYIRVCDVAVNVLDTVLNHPFSFEIDPQKRYSEEELNEAKNTLSHK